MAAGRSRDQLDFGGVSMGTGVKTDVRTYQLFINGKWQASSGSSVVPVYDPSTEEIIAQVPDANSEDVDRAVVAARAAFETWSQTTAQERGRALFRLAEKIRKESTKLTHLESHN